MRALVAELEAICENVPEGCTPADARVLREANHRLTNDFFNTLQKLKAADDERDALRSRVAELEAQAQAVEDSEICAMAELMMIHDRFMRGVLTKEIMIDAVNRVGKESIAKIKADAERYRWLRSEIENGAVQGVSGALVELYDETMYDDGDELDAAIDAAMAKEQGDE